MPPTESLNRPPCQPPSAPVSPHQPPSAHPDPDGIKDRGPSSGHRPESNICRRNTEETQKNTNMFCSRVVVLVLALHWITDKMAAAALLSKNKRELDSQEASPGRLLEGDLCAGDGAAEMERQNTGPEHIQAPLAPTQRPAARHQFQYIRRKSEKRRKAIPLDSIGRFKV
ncbi:hypothetical protein NQD34_013868 [Periophthalmus magnuspinnatus]|nr:hypothetical protein NQD34_013868 [Periophthalmus magnuspinnatus]